MSATRSRWSKALLWSLSAVLGLVGAATAYGVTVWSRQGLDPDDLDPGAGATVEVDAQGIPTITAPDWGALVEAQGYVVAANRLWQMDLMRRKSGGGLSAWFGAAAVEADRSRLEEDWPGVAARLAEALPPDERGYCERYAKGVNRFIEEEEGRWGVEYAILRVEPAPWSCTDTMLVMMAMADDLSTSSDDDAATWGWREALDPEWEDLLFPEDHPWNRPIFGENPLRLALPSTRLDGGAVAPPAAPAEEIVPGSNSWAWRGPTGAFLANDPHLGANVPHLWFLVRMRVSAQDWVVGSAIPGIPGVVLGMSPRVAWSFTNAAEDVDDLLLERVSEDGERYLSKVVTGADGQAEEVWIPIERKSSTLVVKDSAPVEVVARFTKRGPLSRRAALGGAWASRQWLPFQDPDLVAHLPVIAFARARTLDEFEVAVSRFRFPAQNVLAMDRAGNILYRTSGMGVVRTANGEQPRDALSAAWAGLAPVSERPRLLKPAEAAGPAWVVTANARIWEDDWHHEWASDRRTRRIEQVLANRADFTQEDMEDLQRDTMSRLHQLLLEWTAARHTPRDDAEAAMIARWRAWDGFATSDPKTFSEALAVETAIRDTLLEQVRRHLLPPDLKEEPYNWARQDAWMLLVLGAGDPGAETAVDWEAARARAGVDRFGLTEEQLAAAAVRAASGEAPLYSEANRWAAQHPFVGRVPVVGDYFAIGTPQQQGWPNLVRVERPKGGASARFVWNLAAPAKSTWITPVGQSGHLRSEHYADLQPRWHADQRLLVFDDGHDWGFN